MHRAVDPRHLRGVKNLVRHHWHPIGHGELDDVGQVVLALSVLVVQARQPRLEAGGRYGHDAAVNLANVALRGAGVLVFHDGLHHVAPALDAAVAGGVGKINGQQRQLVATASGNEVAQGVGLGQGHIARKHHHDAVIPQYR